MHTNHPLCDISFLQIPSTCSFLLGPQRALSILSPGCRNLQEMLCPLQNVFQIVTYFSHVVNTFSLPCMVSQHMFFFRAKRLNSSCCFLAKHVSNILFLVCKTLHNMTIFSQMYLTSCCFLPPQYLQHAPTYHNVRCVC